MASYAVYRLTDGAKHLVPIREAGKGTYSCTELQDRIMRTVVAAVLFIDPDFRTNELLCSVRSGGFVNLAEERAQVWPFRCAFHFFRKELRKFEVPSADNKPRRTTSFCVCQLHGSVICTASDDADNATAAICDVLEGKA